MRWRADGVPSVVAGEKETRRQIFIYAVLTVIASLAAWSARETYRLQTKDLGKPDAVPVPAAEYNQARAQALASAKR